MTAADWDRLLGARRVEFHHDKPFDSDYLTSLLAYCDWLWDEGLEEESGAFRTFLKADKWPFFDAEAWPPRGWVMWADQDWRSRVGQYTWHSELPLASEPSHTVRAPTLLEWVRLALAHPTWKEFMQCST